MTQIYIDDGLGVIKLEELSPTSYRLIEPFTYNTDDGRQVHVPAGYITDGFSSPLRIVMHTFGGRYSTAAVVHDFLYSTNVLSRVEADAILFEIMSKTHVNFWVKWATWFIVRGFGGPLLKGIGVRNE